MLVVAPTLQVNPFPLVAAGTGDCFRMTFHPIVIAQVATEFVWQFITDGGAVHSSRFLFRLDLHDADRLPLMP